MTLRTIEIDDNWAIKGYKISRIGGWGEVGEYYLFAGNVYQYGGERPVYLTFGECYPPLPLIFLEKI